MSETDLRRAEAALRRFPSEHRLIDELMHSGGDFCDMCEELAEAEAALKAAEGLPTSIRTERVAEWTAVIGRLVGEIARALKEAYARRNGPVGPLPRSS